MWLRKISDRSQGVEFRANRAGVKPAPTPLQVVKALRQRHYSWGKPLRQIADETGLHVNTIRAVIRGDQFTPETYARLVGYIKTPAGPAALINSRYRGDTSTGPRRDLMRRCRHLGYIATRLGFAKIVEHRLNEKTIGQLWAYYWQLEFRVKERIIKERIQLARRYILPDHLQAFEWIERLDQLAEHLQKSGSGRRPSLPSEAMSTYPPMKRKTRSH